MIGWLVLGGYVVAMVFTYRLIWVALDSDPVMRLDGEGGFEIGMLVVLCVLTSAFWPLGLIGYTFWRFATPVTPRQRKEELDARECEIARLERELGIGKDRR